MNTVDTSPPQPSADLNHSRDAEGPEPSPSNETDVIASAPLTGTLPAALPASEDPSSSTKLKPTLGLVCQVEDCRAPLEGLKDYHQRYKVCDRHLKLEYIEKDGHRFRFCQQCGKFQPLEDFDDTKRSCRVRLQQHNARRRKRPRDAAVQEAAISAGIFTQDEVTAMQDAMAFASATLMQNSTQTGANLQLPQGVDVVTAAASATIAGLPFGGGLQSMPFIPSRHVMQLLLKAYAGMFHYDIESIALRPRGNPTPIDQLNASLEAATVAAAAAAAAMAGAAADGAVAAAHLAAIQSHEEPHLGQQ